MVNTFPDRREDLALTSFFPRSGPPAEWRVADSPVAYEQAVETMEKAGRRDRRPATNRSWSGCWNTPPLYTSGTSAKDR